MARRGHDVDSLRRAAPIALVPALLMVACQEQPGSEIVIETDELPGGRMAMDYSTQLSCADEADEPLWEVISGELPPGLSLSDDGLLDGAPAGSGEFIFEVAVDDGLGDDVVELSIHVPDVVLLSGFEPFGGYETNPSWDALVPLDQVLVAGLDLRVIEIPVEWDVSWELLLDEIERLDPLAVIGTGMADTDAMRYELRARNLENYTDNAGVTAWNEPVVEGAESELFTDLPVEVMAEAVEAGGLATTTSSDAGSFLCNHIFYHLTYFEQVEAEDPPLTGFIHVPPAPFAGTFEVEDITLAHELGLEALAGWLAGERRRSGDAPDTANAPTYHLSRSAPPR